MLSTARIGSRTTDDKPATTAIRTSGPFYHQLLSAQLFEKAGLTALAQQHYHSLLLVGQQLQLSEWEPALIALLTEKQRQLKP